ncbi:MAG: hypothetical protein HN658_01305 [Rhodospirillales bacterium]|jgi:hypothetical protein|nr:hypothetical protein [Rhodospirillales bacterium]MBT4006582.1 hypothetical protein [Rhodospirillales bacterium]MBT5076012.1 hypothetical protein [Rhodospirillales bacterium]MBT5113860.1 hypothetical protein [Rhodospirillales bacterium]MBT5672388.1 hypothetical protein [Rhodospirillales bacterium]
MTVSCVKPMTGFRTLLAASCLTALMIPMGSSGAGAQAKILPPENLAPPKPLGASGAASASKALPAQLPKKLPSTVSPIPVSVTPVSPSPAPSKGIKVDTLGAIDPNSVGLLDAKAGGLGIDMWKGTSADLVSKYLPRLPAPPGLASARSLVRRLLLSAARPPVAHKPAVKKSGVDAKKEPSLVARRVDRILALGDLESAAALLRVVPVRTPEEAIAIARRDVAFLLNDNAGACAESQSRIRQFQSVSWRKALVFCQLIAGEGAKASIGAELLREQEMEDEAFFSLVQILGGDRGTAFAAPDQPKPLHLAMMRAGRIQIPDAVVEKGSAAMLRSVAFSPNATLDSRLDAAERAEAYGTLKPSSLAKLYGSINFPPADIAGALTQADKLSGPRARALLYHAAQTQTVAAARAEILAKVFSLARAQGRTGTAVRVFMPILAQVDPSDELAWFAREAARALYLAGAVHVADGWLELATRVGQPPKENPDKASMHASVPADVALWPLSVLASVPLKSQLIPTGAEVSTGVVPNGETSVTETSVIEPVGAAPFDVAKFERWWKSNKSAGDDVQRQRASLFLALAEALGIKVPGVVWLKVATDGRENATLAQPGLIKALEHGAKAGRLAETVLLSAIALGDEAPGKLHPSIIAPVVRSLIIAGFSAEARAMAVETVFGAGL